ncbi:hypothetical protein D3C85_1373290 [compost metagenome]
MTTEAEIYEALIGSGGSRMIDPIALLVLMILACWAVLEKCRRIMDRNRRIYGGGK